MTRWVSMIGAGLAVWSVGAAAFAQTATPAAVDNRARRTKPPLSEMSRSRLDQLLRQSERERGQSAGRELLLLENQCLGRGRVKSLEVQFENSEQDPIFAVLPRLSQEWVRLSWVGDARALVLGFTSERASAQPGALFISTPKHLLHFELAREGFPVLVDRDADTVVVLYQAWQSQRAQLARVDWSGPKLTELLALPNLPGMPQELINLEGRYYLQWGSVLGRGEVVRLVENGGVGARYRLESSGSRLFKSGGVLYVVDKAQRKLVRLDADLKPVEHWRIETGAAPRAKGPARAL